MVLKHSWVISEIFPEEKFRVAYHVSSGKHVW
jgi:hypothetical protein